MLLLRHCLRVTMVVAGATALAAGCGGLRELPVNGHDAAAGGASGSSAGAGRGGSGGVGGVGGSAAGTGGSTMIVDAGGVDAPMCVAGGACVPANPCHKGMFVCNENAMVCMELTDLQANGTVCGADKVCRNGSCDACVAGMACDVTGKPCRVGSIVCTTGAPVCTETDNKPNGTMCGTGMVCQAGACAACQMGGACTPTNKCHTGMLVCSGAAPSCTDTNANVGAGTSCGTDMVCNATGTCGACVQGMDCAVPGKPCRKGTIACNTGTPVCIETADQPNGTVCGTGMVCQAGTCAACSAGTVCVPANPCHVGITVCTPTIACTDTGNVLTNGASCGTDKVCNAGTCVSCAAGASCQPANACRTGVVSCATGSPVCSETGNRPNGTVCGTNMVCTNGSCATDCPPNSACTPMNPCHTGTLSCATGAPVCTDSGSNQPDGTACGMNLVCKTGMCVSCTAGQPCQPTNPCKTGQTSCSTGSSVCVESGNKGQGAQCGPPQSCSGGVVTLQGACNATGMCVAGTMQCTTGCNTAGTDCATCPPGQTSCPQGCKNLTSDVTNCGMCGNVCPSPAGGAGIPTCGNSTCGILCNAGFVECSPPSLGICQPTVWDFEDMSIEGYRVITTPSAAGKLGVTSQFAHSGKFSLGAIIKATGTGLTRGFQIGPLMCADKGLIPGKGVTVTGWMLIEPSDPKETFGPNSYWGIRITTESGETLAKGSPRGYNMWFPVQVAVPAGDVRLISFVLEGVFAPEDTRLPTDWTGTMYFDDISIDYP